MTTLWAVTSNALREAEHLDVESLDEHGHAPTGVGTTDADVVKTALMSQRHRTARVHLVEAQTPIVDRDHRVKSQ
ncbi:MAG TPA: hypothetical protein VHZ02_01835 [Acidimicrobiales bacterium]|nr:hypothetical protein [Acidimicrobiales bacterium]